MLNEKQKRDIFHYLLLTSKLKRDDLKNGTHLILLGIREREIIIVIFSFIK